MAQSDEANVRVGNALPCKVVVSENDAKKIRTSLENVLSQGSMEFSFLVVGDSRPLTTIQTDAGVFDATYLVGSSGIEKKGDKIYCKPTLKYKTISVEIEETKPVLIDDTPPILKHESGELLQSGLTPNDSFSTVKFSASDANGDAISFDASHQCGSAIQTQVSGDTLTIFGTMPNLSSCTFEVFAVADGVASNTKNFSLLKTNNVTPPTVVLSSTPSTPSANATLNIGVGGANVDSYKYLLKTDASACSAVDIYSASWISVATPITNVLTGPSHYRLCVIGRTADGVAQSSETPTTHTWVYTTGSYPATTLANTPASSSLSSSLNVVVSGLGVTEYKYAIVTAGSCNAATYSPTWTSVSSAITDVLGADDSYTLCVIGRDELEHEQLVANATSYAWVKDTVAPTAAEISLVGTPASVSNATALSITVGGSGVVNYKYALTTQATACSAATFSASWVSVATPISNALGADGTLRLCVIGQDATGNATAQAAAKEFNWTKNTAPAVATLTGEPTGSSNATALNVTVAGTNIVTYKYAVISSGTCADAAYSVSWIAVATPLTYALAADNNYTLCVIGKNTADTEQAAASATSADWTKDTVAPAAAGISLTGTPSSISNSTSVNIAVGGAGVVNYKFALTTQATSCSAATYSASWTAVATPITNGLGADGSLRLCVVGQDAAGNATAEANAKAFDWIKDTTAPTAAEITLSGAPSAVSNETALNITVGGAGVVNYKYALTTPATACSAATYSGSWIAVATPISNALGADGNFRLCVIAQDVSNNATAEASAKEFNWEKNSAAVTATLSGTPASFSNATALNVTVGGTDVVSYQYSVIDSGTCSAAAYNGSWIAVATPITAALGADDDYTLCVIGKNTAETEQTVANATSHAWTKDTVAPIAAEISFTGTPASVSKTTDLNIAVGGTGVLHYKFAVTTQATACSDATYSVAWIAVATPITNALGADGNLRLCVIGQDAANNSTAVANAKEFDWTKDTTAPTAGEISLTNTPEDTNNVTTLGITVSGTGVSGYRYKLSTTNTCSSASGYSGADALVATQITENISSLADGSVFLCVIGIDAADNMTAHADAKVVSWTKDTQAPTASLAAVTLPSSTSNTTSLGVNVEGAGVTHYLYALLGPNSADTCTNATYTDVGSKIVVATSISNALGADGAYLLCVKGLDAAGNVQSTATSYAWTKDIVAPNASDIILSGTPTGTNGTTSLNISVSGVVSYRYKISTTDTCANDADYSGSDLTIATPITNDISALAEGSIFLCVRAKDVAGNLTTSADAKVVSWTKDTTAPSAGDITLSGTPTGVNKTTALDITVSGVTSYRYKIATTNTCTTDADYSGSDIVVATKITNSVSGFADGSVYLCVRAKDAVGNLTAAADAKVVSWTKDTTAPTASLGGLPASSSNATSLNVSVSGADVDTYIFSLLGPDSADTCANATYTNEGSAIAVATPITNALGADGAYLLCVKGLDAAGNVQSTATSYAWTKDIVAPNASDIILSGTPTGTNGTTSLNISVSGVVSYRYKISTTDTCANDADYSGSDLTIATPITNDISALAEGSIFLCVRAKDVAGNLTASADAKVVSWTKDTTAPSAGDITLSGTPTGVNKTTALDITVSGVTSYRYKIATTNTCTTDADYSGSDIVVATKITNSVSGLADGSVYLCVRAKDAVGNLTAAADAKVVSWTKDTTAPTASLGGLPASSSNATSLNVSVSGADVDTYIFSLLGPDSADTCVNATYTNEGSAIAVATPITNALGADGAYLLCVKGLDAAGNVQNTATSYAWTKDIVAPSASDITLSNLPANPSSATALDVTVGGTDVVGYRYSLTTQATACASATYSDHTLIVTKITDSLSNGSLRLCVRGQDAAGNLTAAADADVHNWTQDNNEPQSAHIALSNTPGARSNATPLSITVAADVSWTHSSFTHTNFALVQNQTTSCDDGSVIYNGWNATMSISPNISTDGNKRLCIRVRTASGKETPTANAKVFDWVFDTTSPVANDILLTGTPSNPSKAAALNVLVEANGAADVVKYKFALTTQATSCAALADGTYSASWLDEGTSITENVGANGARRLCVMAQDQAGNSTKNNAKNFDWTHDTVAPTVSLTADVSPTTLSTSSTQASLTFQSNELGTYEVVDNTDAQNIITVKSGSVSTANSNVVVNFYPTDLLAGDGIHTLSLRVFDVAGNEKVTALSDVTVMALRNLAVNFYHDGTNQSQHKLQWESDLDVSRKIKIVRAVDTTTPPATVGGGTLIATLDGDKIIHTFNGVTNTQIAFSLFSCDGAGDNCIFSAGTSYNKDTVVQNDSEGNILKVRFSGIPVGSTVRLGYSKNKTDLINWNGVTTSISDGAAKTCASSPCSETFANDTTHPAWTKLYYLVSTTTSGGVTSFSEMGYWAKVPPGMVFVSKEDWPVEFTGHNYTADSYDGSSGPFDYAIDKYEVYLASGSVTVTTAYPNADTAVLKSAAGQTAQASTRWFTFKQGCENRTTDGTYASYVGNTRLASAGATFQNPRVRVHLTTDAEWMIGAYGTPDTDTTTCSFSTLTTTGAMTNCLSRYGAMDMIGNYYEWTDSRFASLGATSGDRTAFYGTGSTFPIVETLSGLPSSSAYVSTFNFANLFPSATNGSGVAAYFLDYFNKSTGTVAAARGGGWVQMSGAGRYGVYIANVETMGGNFGGRCALVKP